MVKNLTKLAMALAFVITLFSINSSAQQRDSLTYEEIEMIRDIQQLDGRMEIYIKAIDRRLIVLKNTSVANNPLIEKENSKWGALPKGTKAELLSDIRKILDETIDKIDDVADRDAKNDLIPYSLHLLADGVKRIKPELQKLKETTTEPREIGLINNSLESCEQILEAASNVAKPDKKPKPKKN